LNFPENSFSKQRTNIKFHENPPSGSRVVSCAPTHTDGRTYMNLIVAFRHFANSSKKLVSLYTIKCVIFIRF